MAIAAGAAPMTSRMVREGARLADRQACQSIRAIQSPTATASSTRFGRIARAAAIATPAANGQSNTTSTRTSVHAAVTGTSVIGFIAWNRKTGLDATSAAAQSDGIGRLKILSPSTNVSATQPAAAIGTMKNAPQ